MTLFAHSPDFKKIEKERRTGDYDPSSKRLREGLKLTQSGLLGNVAFEMIGRENLLSAARDSVDNGGVVVASDHLTDVSVSVAAAVAAQLTKIKIPVASTNFEAAHQEIPYRIAGLDTVYKVPYRFAEGFDRDKSRADHKVTGRFDSRDYDELVEDMVSQGFSVVAAAHNPMTMHDFENKGKLPEKPGKLVPHLSLATGRPILPVLMQVEGQQLNPSQLNDNAIHPSWTLSQKDVRMTFGEAVTPTGDEVGNYREVLEDLWTDNPESARKKQREVLERLGHVVLDWMHDTYDDRLALSGKTTRK